MLDRLVSILRPGGLLVTDNVLWDGEVVPGFITTPRRDPADTAAIAEYNRRLSHDPRLLTSIVPLRDGVAMADALFAHPAVAGLVGAPVTDLSTDAAIRANVAHYYHPVGTAKMGDGPDAVCDARGRVHGLERVVVGDASLYPQIMRGNTNMPAVMTGERIAQFLLAD